jgi:lysocardiolipin and lysophospholipid acyltransferase
MKLLRGITFVLSLFIGLVITFIALLPWLFLMPIRNPAVQRFRRIYVIEWDRLYFCFASSVIEFVGGTKVFIHFNKNDNIFDDKNVIVLSNHRTRVDIIFGWSYAAFHSVFPYIIVILKDSLKKIPFFGWCMQAVGFIFLGRNRDTDVPYIKRVLNYHLKQSDMVDRSSSYGDYWIYLFPEGTDLSESRKQKSHECK